MEPRCYHPTVPLSGHIQCPDLGCICLWCPWLSQSHRKQWLACRIVGCCQILVDADPLITPPSNYLQPKVPHTTKNDAKQPS